MPCAWSGLCIKNFMPCAWCGVQGLYPVPVQLGVLHATWDAGLESPDCASCHEGCGVCCACSVGGDEGCPSGWRPGDRGSRRRAWPQCALPCAAHSPWHWWTACHTTCTAALALLLRQKQNTHELASLQWSCYGVSPGHVWTETQHQLAPPPHNSNYTLALQIKL